MTLAARLVPALLAVLLAAPAASAAANVAPQAAFAWLPAAPTPASLLRFTDQSTDADGHVVGWLWDFGGGAASTARNPARSFATGSHRVCLTAVDDDGARSAVCHDIVVDWPPQAAFAWGTGPISNLAPVLFADRSADRDGHMAWWAWDFGDGTTSGAPEPAKRFAHGGDYDVCLTVRDDLGASDRACRVVHVLAATMRGRAQALAAPTIAADTAIIVRDVADRARVVDRMAATPAGPLYGLAAEVRTAPGRVGSAARIVYAHLALPGGHALDIIGLRSHALATCTSASGGASVWALRLDGVRLDAGTLVPNASRALPGGAWLELDKLSLARASATVTALRLHVPGAADVVLGQVSASVANCPARLAALPPGLPPSAPPVPPVVIVPAPAPVPAPPDERPALVGGLLRTVGGLLRGLLGP